MRLRMTVEIPFSDGDLFLELARKHTPKVKRALLPRWKRWKFYIEACGADEFIELFAEYGEKWEYYNRKTPPVFWYTVGYRIEVDKGSIENESKVLAPDEHQAISKVTGELLYAHPRARSLQILSVNGKPI